MAAAPDSRHVYLWTNALFSGSNVSHKHTLLDRQNENIHSEGGCLLVISRISSSGYETG